MDQYRSRLKLSENFERHWSIQISGEIHMDKSLVHTFFWGHSYGPMVLKVLLKFPPTLVLVHGWLFPAQDGLPSLPAGVPKMSRNDTPGRKAWEDLLETFEDFGPRGPWGSCIWQFHL